MMVNMGLVDKGCNEKPIAGKLLYTTYTGCEFKFKIDMFVLRYMGAKEYAIMADKDVIWSQIVRDNLPGKKQKT